MSSAHSLPVQDQSRLHQPLRCNASEACVSVADTGTQQDERSAAGAQLRRPSLVVTAGGCIGVSQVSSLRHGKGRMVGLALDGVERSRLDDASATHRGPWDSPSPKRLLAKATSTRQGITMTPEHGPTWFHKSAYASHNGANTASRTRHLRLDFSVAQKSRRIGRLLNQ